MNLEYVLLNLERIYRDTPICAREPWCRDSGALGEIVPDEDDPLSANAAKFGRQYFLEVSIAPDCLKGWISHLDYTPSTHEIRERLIYYANYDA